MSVEPPPASTSSAGRCTLCGKPQSPDYRPFCSRRCADVDLHRWLSGSYVIAGMEDEPHADPDQD